MTLAALRESIVATDHGVYMNTGWSGPSPEPVHATIGEYLLGESTVGAASIEGLRRAREANETAQAAVAALLNAAPEEIILTHGTTEGVYVVLHGTTWREGDELVTCDLEHVALSAPAAVLEERHGVTVKRLAIPAAAAEREMIDLVAAAVGPRTRIVALSHVQYTCGLKMPVRAIADLAHAAGALLLVDGAQTAGQIPLDMRALGADFYAVSGQKWLLGPQATGALFVAREQARAIEPLFTTHALADDRRLRAETALAPSPLSRFRLTAQAPALVAGLARAIGLVQEIGSEAIEAHVNRLAARLRRGVATIEGCAITGPTDPSVACGLVAVAIEGWEPRQTVEALLSRGRITARAVNQPPAVRFSTGAFNTEAEVDLVLETLSAIARERPPVEAPAAADR